jgi:dienelactone hydrolase
VGSFPGASYRDYSRGLPDFLRDLAARAYRTRNQELAGLTTPEAIRKRQAWARETFWRLIGGMPARTPLNARVTGSFERAGYRVEKVVYEGFPRLFITANLYIPTAGSAPYPGVLFQMGHSGSGKADPGYQRCCQGLARLGFMVLAIDPMGQGERIYYPQPGRHSTRLPSVDDEHTVPGRQVLLFGDTVTRTQTWDAVRSLDYLAAHPLVDPQRLGATGQSGGATVTMFLVAVDDRVAAAVVCSGITENVACAGFNPPGSTDDAEQNFVDSGPAAFDRWDVLYPMAPKPLLVTVSDKDYFGTYSPNYLSSGWEEYGKLRRVYERLGSPQNLGWGDTPLPHGLSYDSRLRVYNWFARHLQGRPQPIAEEPPTNPESDETLWVAPGGDAVRAFGSETVFTLNRKHPVKPGNVPLDRLLRVDRPPAGLRAAVLARVPSFSVDIEALEVPSAPQVWLPAWLFLPRARDASRPALLLLDANGRNGDWREGALYQNLAAQGSPVCAADLRMIGDVLPEFGRGAAAHARAHASEEDYAWSSLILGKSLAGQRVTDILALAAALRAHPALAGRPLRLAASGRLTVPALFAAALDPLIGSLYLAGGLVSFRNVVDTEDYSTPFANFVPELLLSTDLPQVAASLAPRRLTLAGTVDAADGRMDVAEVRALYPGPHITVAPAAAWNEAALLG